VHFIKVSNWLSDEIRGRAKLVCCNCPA